MNVCWSSARSASCSRVRRTCAFASRSAPRRIATCRSSAVNVHALVVDLDRQRAGRDERERGNDRAGVLVDAGRQLVVEEARRGRNRPAARRSGCVRRLPWPTTLGRCADPKRRRPARGNDRRRGRDRSARFARVHRARPCAAAGSVGRVEERGRARRGRASRAGCSRWRRGRCSAPRFHLVSMSFRIDVWSCTWCDT